jgi:hypothetical protein
MDRYQHPHVDGAADAKSLSPNFDKSETDTVSNTAAQNREDTCMHGPKSTFTEPKQICHGLI